MTEKEAEHRRENQDKLVNASIKYTGIGSQHHGIRHMAV
jgi:hypothetical protein